MVRTEYTHNKAHRRHDGGHVGTLRYHFFKRQLVIYREFGGLSVIMSVVKNGAVRGQCVHVVALTDDIDVFVDGHSAVAVALQASRGAAGWW